MFGTNTRQQIRDTLMNIMREVDYCDGLILSEHVHDRELLRTMGSLRANVVEATILADKEHQKEWDDKGFRL